MAKDNEKIKEVAKLMVNDLMGNLEQIVEGRELLLSSSGPISKKAFEDGFKSLSNEYLSMFNFLSNYLNSDDKENYSRLIETKILAYKAKIYEKFSEDKF